jgi:myosin heavy subunit
MRTQVLEGKVKEGEPHVYQLAGRAFEAMRLGGNKQAIVISG